MKTYISGKITGLPIEEALANFEAAEREVERLGFEPVNPMALFPEVPGKTWKEYMNDCVDILFDCEAIFLQANWTESKGARIERAIARELGLRVIMPRGY